MTQSKTYKVGFYTFGTLNNFPGTIADQLSQWINPASAPTIERNSTKYEIRNLVIGRGQYKGYIGKLRYDDLPHASKSGGGDERELDLAEDEGLLEKNFFIYDIVNGILIYQHHGNGTSYAQFASYLTDAIGATVSVNPVIQPDALRRLMRGDAEPKMVELSIAKPAANFVGEAEMTRELVALMNGSEGMRLSMKISLGRGRNPVRRLAEGVKGMVAELMDHGVVSVAKFHVSEDGDTHPIDLMTDRVVGEVRVEIFGRYPSSTGMFTALQDCWNASRATVLQSVGQGENALV